MTVRAWMATPSILNNSYHQLTSSSLWGRTRYFLCVQEYMRVCGHDAKGEDAIYLLLRILHQIPRWLGFLPEAYIGEPYPAYPDDLRLFPRFPHHVVDDVPLLLVRGYFVVGGGSPSYRTTQYAGRIEWRKSALEVPETTEKPSRGGSKAP